ncbi:MAG: BspA family leucine-rich repeat surface protein [Bacteroidota bacterium]
MKKFVLIAAATFLITCGKDDSTEGPSNQIPTLESLRFSVVDDLTDTETIGTVIGVDEDDDELTYSLVQNPKNLFAITPNGELRLAQGKTLDFATAQQHNLTVSVTDGQHTETASITIMVTSANHVPTIAPQTFTVPENIAYPETIGEIVAEDPDGDDISFAILEQGEDNLFEVTWRGMLRLVEGKSLDFATNSKHVITMAVGDNEDSASTQITITVTEVDETNLSPIVDDQTFEGIPEDITDDFPIATVEAQDPEGDALIFSILENDQGLFAINETNGVLNLAEGQSLDFESVQEHTIIIRVSDGNTFADAQIVITLSDVEEAPIKNDQSFEVLETAKEIGKVTASDPQNDALTFSLLDDDEGRFTITSSGDIKLAPGKFLNFEQAEEHQITVLVTDTQDNSTQAVMTIKVLDVDEAPLLTSPMEYDVLENIPDDEVIGTIIAKDPEGKPVELTLKDDAEELFEMADDGSLSLASGKSLDYETLPNLYEIIVTADDGENARDFIITIRELDVNEAPKIADQFVFEAYESINDVVVIGTVTAEDPDGDALVFEIGMNDNSLFEINAAGELSLAPEKNLDFELNQQHQITVLANDGEFNAETDIIINVKNSFADEVTPFITTWQTTTNNEEIKIGTGNFEYEFSVDWGDGNIENVSFNGNSGFFHNYETPDTYTVVILGNFPSMDMLNAPQSATKLRSVEQWGSAMVWQSMRGTFSRCSNMLPYSASDIPNLSQVESMVAMFARSNFTGYINDWNTQNITDMNSTFVSSNFNDDISEWDTQNVTNMMSMFGDSDFNGDISEWNTQNVENMTSMFASSAFDGDISEWNTQNVTNMNHMFANSVFSGNISGWDTRNVTNMNSMFINNTDFNQNLGNWNVESLQTATFMFAYSEILPQNYSQTLVGWAEQFETPLNVEFTNQIGMEFCDTPMVQDARQVLIGKGWEITGDTETDCN